MQTLSRPRIRLIAVVAITLTVSLFAYAAAADNDLPGNGGTIHDQPIPVEPDGGIGDGAGPLESES